MGEKKTRKIALVAILLIMAVIVNVAMSCYICIDKINDNKTVAEYEASASALQKTIDDLYESVDTIQKDSNEKETRIDDMYQEINDLQNEIASILYSDEEDIIDATAKILFFRGAVETMKARCASGFPYVPSAEPSVFITINDLEYEKMAVSYSDIVKKYSMIFTGNALDEFLDIRFADVDGDLYVLYGGMSGWRVSSGELTRVSEADGEIKYSVSFVSNFGSDEFPDKVEDTCSMTIKLVDGGYRISEFDYFKN